MKSAERVELRRTVEDLHRRHPEWTAREIESEIRARFGVLFGDWADETKDEESRIRSIQRWRGANRWSASGPLPRSAFPQVWPVGERQRHEVDLSFAPGRSIATGSWRLFLYNCGTEIARDVRLSLDGIKVGYSPAVLVGKFTEIHWRKVEALLAESLNQRSGPASEHELAVEFVSARGTKELRLDGSLKFDPSQGWTGFVSREDRSTEIE